MEVADPARNFGDLFNYGQYRRWPEDKRWELIDGEAWAIAAPSADHQRILGRLYRKFDLYERSNVREYWVVDPFARSVQVWHLVPGGRFDRGELREAAADFSAIASKALEGLTVDPRELFAELQ